MLFPFFQRLPEPVTQSRTWAVSWLAAARAVRRDRNPDYGTAALAQALHDKPARLA